MRSDLYELLSHEVVNFVRGGLSGVSKAIKRTLFTPGVTSKSHRGTRNLGSGLANTRKALLESGTDIQLLEPGPGGTVFSITFPKPPQESDHAKQNKSFPSG